MTWQSLKDAGNLGLPAGRRRIDPCERFPQVAALCKKFPNLLKLLLESLLPGIEICIARRGGVAESVPAIGAEHPAGRVDKWDLTA